MLWGCLYLVKRSGKEQCNPVNVMTDLMIYRGMTSRLIIPHSYFIFRAIEQNANKE